MNWEQILDHFKISDGVLQAAITQVIARYGVPTSVDDVDTLTQALLMEVVEQRRYLYARQLDIVRSNENLPEVAPLRWYNSRSLHTVVRTSAGLTPRPALANIEVLDPVTQKTITNKLAPWTAPEDPVVIDEFGRRLNSYTGQHTKSSARELVRGSARLNRTGWARRLTGAENCAWCSMLASRGAQYSFKSVSFEAHPHCDCFAVMATGDNWSGKEESEELYELWKQSDGLAGFRENLRKRAA